jgi:hypothetical protein
MSKPDPARASANDPILQRYARDLRVLARKTVDDVVKIGELLTKAQKRVGHGGWLEWLERELRWSDDTARNYMDVYRLKRKLKSRKFRLLADRLAPSVMYLLAREGTSDAMREEVLARLARGEPLTPSTVKKLVTVQVSEPAGGRIWPLWPTDTELPTSPPARSLPLTLPRTSPSEPTREVSLAQASSLRALVQVPQRGSREGEQMAEVSLVEALSSRFSRDALADFRHLASRVKHATPELVVEYARAGGENAVHDLRAAIAFVDRVKHALDHPKLKVITGAASGEDDEATP